MMGIGFRWVAMDSDVFPRCWNVLQWFPDRPVIGPVPSRYFPGISGGVRWFPMVSGLPGIPEVVDGWHKDRNGGGNTGGTLGKVPESIGMLYATD